MDEWMCKQMKPEEDFFLGQCISSVLFLRAAKSWKTKSGCVCLFLAEVEASEVEESRVCALPSSR